MSPWGFVRSIVSKLSLASALGVASGCASALPLEPTATSAADVGPTLDSPYVIRVCVKPSAVPSHTDFWANDSMGGLVLEDWALAQYQRNGHSIFYFDPFARPESARMLPIPHNTLQCAEPKPSVLLSNGKVTPPKPQPEVQQSVAASTPTKPTTTTSTATSATTAQAKIPPPCTNTIEPGQTRSRGTTTQTCVRSRTLQASTRKAANAHVAKAEAKPAQESPTLAQAAPAPASPSLLDWNVPAPNFSVPALDPQRVVECATSLCHARHPNFAPKGGKPAATGVLEQRSLSTGGGGAKAPSFRNPPTGPKPVAKPPATAKPTQTGAPVKPKANGAPKVKEPHGNRVDDRPATLYEKVDKDGKLLKHGVTKHPDPNKRYTEKQIGDGRVIRTERGPRKEMIKKERELVETNPGPENREPWAGKKKTQVGGKGE